MTSDVCITEKLRKHAHTHTPCPKLALCPHAVSISHTHTHFKGQYRQFPASKVLKNGNWGPPAPLSRSLKKFTRFSPRRFTSFVSLGLWSLLLVSLLLVPFFFLCQFPTGGNVKRLKHFSLTDCGSDTYMAIWVCINMLFLCVE